MHFLCIEDKHESNSKNKNKGRICWPIQQYAICTFQIPVCMLDKTNYIYDLGTGASIQEDIHMWELPFNQHRKLLSVSQSVREKILFFFFFVTLLPLCLDAYQTNSHMSLNTVESNSFCSLYNQCNQKFWEHLIYM